MSQNICNICGANYEYRNGRWVCPACGAYKAEELSNEEVTLLYNAAQKLRFANFDEAEEAYTDIIEKYPQNPDGYWGRLLSKYGIKYEEDFDGRKIPTCYATSIDSVISDKDYLKALELADEHTKEYYQAQAAYIERVRKEWVEKASKEKPYDIFICYKDSDLAHGIERTQDSIEAQDLYIHLTNQGYRVFFSRESLRDKIGEKYEPYIFNALSTAKVMLVYGSSAEYVTSTWLKNEWHRYYKRILSGEKHKESLIVACDGFSPNELPKTLSSRQCLDAKRKTFFLDLDKCIKRIVRESTSFVGGEEQIASSLHNHKYKTQIIKPTCLSKGYTVYKCDCGYEYRDGFTDLAEHKFTVTNNVQPTCEHGGILEKTCEVCGDKTKEILDPLGHNFSDWVEIKAPTRKRIGTRRHQCSHCGIYEDEPIPVVGYDSITAKPDKKSPKRNIKLAIAAALVLVAFLVVNYNLIPFLKEQGYIGDGNNGEDTPPHVHSVVIDAAVEATCTSTGLTAGKHCSTCGEIIVAQQETSKVAHTYTDKYDETCNKCGFVRDAECAHAETETIKGYAATCTSTGLTDGTKCKKCDEILVAQEILSKVAHTYDGKYDNECNVCGDKRDAECTHVLNGKPISEYLIDDDVYMFGTPGMDLLYDAIVGCNGRADASFTCEVCKGKYTVKVGRPDHVLAYDETLNQLPTFDADGRATVVCVNDDCEYCFYVTIPKVVEGENAFEDESRRDHINEKRYIRYSFADEKYGIDIQFEFALNWYDHVIEYSESDTTYPTLNQDGVAYVKCTYEGCEKSGRVIIPKIVIGDNAVIIREATEKNPAKFRYTYFNEEYNFTVSFEGEMGEVLSHKYVYELRDTDIPFQPKLFGKCNQPECTAPEIWLTDIPVIRNDIPASCTNRAYVEFTCEYEGQTYTLRTNEFGDYAHDYELVDSKTIYPAANSTGKAVLSCTKTGCVASQEITLPKVAVNESDPSYRYDEATNIETIDYVYTFTNQDKSYTISFTYNREKSHVHEYEYHLEPSLTEIGKLDLVGICTVRDGYCDYEDRLVDVPAVLVENTGTCTEPGYAIWAYYKDGVSYTYRVESDAVPGHRFIYFDLNAETTLLPDFNNPGQINLYCDACGEFGATVELPVMNIGQNSTVKAETTQQITYHYSVTINYDGRDIAVNTVIFAPNPNYEAASKGLSYTLNNDGNSYSVTGIGTCTDTDIVIPTIYNGLPVTYISSWAFPWCTSLTSIVIPDTVTSIGAYAFYECISLANVSISNGVTSIGEQAFCNCTSLTSVIIGDSVTSIDIYAFWRCTSLTSIAIPDSVTSIGVYALYECTSLTTINFEGTVAQWNIIAKAAFWDNCTGSYTIYCSDGQITKDGTITYNPSYSNGLAYTLNDDGNSYSVTGIGTCTDTAIIIPSIYNGKPVISTGEYAFSFCTKLTSVVIPNSVTSIGDGTFECCNSLTSIVIPPSVTSIGDEAFEECLSLANIEIPASVKSIGDWAFHNCSSLTSIDIPDTVTSIDNYVFAGCTSLMSVEIPDSVTSIGQSAFSSCRSLTSITIPDSVTSIDAQTFITCTALTSITIPDSVTSIGHSAFYGCTSLTSIIISDSVTSIDTYAFYGCALLKNINFEGTIEQWDDIKIDSMWNYGTGSYIIYCTDGQIAKDGTITYNSSYSTGLAYTLNNDGNSYSVTGIGTCTDTNIVIPSTYNGLPVTSIGELAFYGCTSLTSIEIPGSVTRIGGQAFQICTSLESVTIGDSVTSIDYSAFEGCTSLSSIVIPNGVTSISSSTFFGCTALESVYIPDSVTSIGNQAFAECTSLTSVTIPNGVTKIADFAFLGCTSLTSIVIPNGVTSIGYDSFYNCTSLACVTIPSSVTSVDELAFYNCAFLQSISFGATISQWNAIIKESNWNSNTGNYTIYCTDGQIAKDGTITYNPSSPTASTGLAYTLNNDGNSYSITGIGTCKDTNIVIPNTYNGLPVTSIGPSAFSSNAAIVAVDIPDSVTSIGMSAFASCTSLLRVNMSSSVTTIALGAFAQCPSLVAVNYNATLYEWQSVSKITILIAWNYGSDSVIVYCTDGQVTKSGTVTYYESEGLEFTLNSSGDGYSVTGIGTCADTNVVIPQSYNGLPVTEIGASAFKGNNMITGVVIQSPVTKIGASAFSNCSLLTHLSIPDSVEALGLNVFSDCPSLQYNAYDNALYLGNYNNKYLLLAKAKDTSITSCTISAKTKFIYNTGFTVQVNGTSVSFGDEISGFAQCGQLTEIVIPDSVTYIGAGAFLRCYNLTDVTLGTSVKSIDVFAFGTCGSLKNITIGTSVSSIGMGAFYNCISLESIHYNGTREQWSAISKGLLWNANAGSYSIYYVEDESPAGHDPTEYIVTLKPSFTAVGSVDIYCGVCGELVGTVELPQMLEGEGGNCTLISDEGDQALYSYSVTVIFEEKEITVQAHIVIEK